MPQGSRHQLTGLLLKDRGCLSLRGDDGGTWRLDGDPRVRRFVRRSVCLEGERIGFDSLSVKDIWLAGEPRPEPSWWRRLFGYRQS